ncbi:ABC transporter ATP-binding protein [bacterium D16-54]|nr:ABC transporter ATP-binding protein [bacterium D16-54]RKJ16750.1 ABC transporter ATP-binding protein [bacterium D16-56]
MSLVTIEHLTKSYTERLLFDDTAFSIEAGEKVGLIGVNGTGKSTLLKIVAGLEEPDQGNVVCRRNLYVRYLPQNPEFTAGDTVLESIVRDNKKEPHFTSQEELEASAKAIFTRLGIYDYEAKVETLSGGQKKRVALTSVLLSTADLLILDEPTNHLDSEMADWLEGYLKRFRGALLMITHDRYFLDSVTDCIVELDKGKLYRYQTNYEGFVRLKAERVDMALASERKRQSILRTELEWMQRGARARSTKQKAHIQRYEALREEKAPEMDQQVELESVSSRLGRTTVELSGLCKAYGDQVLIKDFTYIFLKNDRVGIIGPNGSGKSTLLKMIAGWVKPDAGEIQIGQTVKLGYFSQENEDMDESLKVIDYIRNVAEVVQTRDGSVSASQMLERFLFPGSVQHTVVGRLSGGERRRLYLLRILMDAPNMLLLDEPTNDLDIQTLTILEDYLDSFSGIVVTVSHDRYFLDRMVKRIFAFEGNGAVVQYEGGFTDYQAAYERKHWGETEPAGIQEGAKNGRTDGGRKNPGRISKEDEAKVRGKKNGEDDGADGTNEQAQALSDSRNGRGHQKKLKFTYKEQKEWEIIEGEIAGLETKLQELDRQIDESATVFGRLSLLMEEKAQAEQALEEKMERWMYLNDLAEQIEAARQ